VVQVPVRARSPVTPLGNRCRRLLKPRLCGQRSGSLDSAGRNCSGSSSPAGSEEQNAGNRGASPALLGPRSEAFVVLGVAFGGHDPRTCAGVDEGRSRLFVPDPSSRGGCVAGFGPWSSGQGRSHRQQRRLSARHRERLVPLITARPQAWGLGQRPQPREMNRHGIRWATEAASAAALQRCPGARPVLVDGVPAYDSWSWPAGFTLVQVIAVAWPLPQPVVLAKNRPRDGLVRRLPLAFPGYRTGAPCRLWHGDAPSGPLRELGGTPLHRSLSLPGCSVSPAPALKSYEQLRPTRFRIRPIRIAASKDEPVASSNRGLAAGPEWPGPADQ